MASFRIKGTGGASDGHYARSASVPAAALVVALAFAACVLATLGACGSTKTKAKSENSDYAKYGALSDKVLLYMAQAFPLMDKAWLDATVADEAYSEGDSTFGLTSDGQAQDEYVQAEQLGPVPVQNAADRALAGKFRVYKHALSRFVFVENSGDSTTSQDYLDLVSAEETAEGAVKALYNELSQ